MKRVGRSTGCRVDMGIYNVDDTIGGDGPASTLYVAKSTVANHTNFLKPLSWYFELVFITLSTEY
jgi:hypothetical protein